MKIVRYILFTLLLCCCIFSFGHIGTPGTSFQGKAGKYNIAVNVYPPDVVPATAQVGVYIENYDGEKVYLQIRYFTGGKKASVAPEQATPVKNSKGGFSHSPMLMSAEMLGLNVIIKGKKGTGTVLIPVTTTVTAQRDMPKSRGAVLVILGGLLFILLIVIIGASVSDGLLWPGSKVPVRIRRRKIVSIIVSALIITVILYKGYLWWMSEHKAYNKDVLFRPVTASSAVVKHNNQNVLHLNVHNDPLAKGSRQSMSYIIPDHGKLMHLFLVKEKALDVFAHLHPVRADSNNFMARIPDIPAGRYFVYADIVRWNGFAETIADTLIVPAKLKNRNVAFKNIPHKPDPDDALHFNTPVIEAPAIERDGKPVSVCGTPGKSIKLFNGLEIIWQQDAGVPFKAKTMYSLTFTLSDAYGKPPVLQPYMGMYGHAVVVKYDCSAYVHLHPTGNYAMASQQTFENRMQDAPGKRVVLPDARKFRDSVDNIISKLDNMSESERLAYFNTEMGAMDMSAGAHSKHSSTIKFPHMFPDAGKYRIWVQVKIQGRILTAAFDAVVVK